MKPRASRPHTVLVILALLGVSALTWATDRPAPPEPGGVGTPAGEAAAADPAPRTPYEWRLPAGFPQPRVPADNPMSEAKVELGRSLFFDPRLSLDGTFTCAGCHDPGRAFTDGQTRPRGVTAELHPRNSMSLANVAYSTHLNWDDPAPADLEDQLLTPLFGHDPVEMGLSGPAELEARLSPDLDMQLAFAEAFPEQPEPLNARNAGRAIAAFERTLISGGSDFDRYMYGGNPDALSAEARRGMRLFFSERLACSSCHGRFTFSGPVHFEGARPESTKRREFHNTGLYDTGDGAYPERNPGLVRHTGEAADRGRFKAPSLRNIEVTAPYMHDGSMESLDEVLDHYAQGGRAPDNPFKDPEVSGFHLTCQERDDLLAFLRSLTDWDFLEDPRFQNPSG
ncbi:MAG: MbnH family di-heme enzyme [Acidobacteriota bacterium]